MDAPTNIMLTIQHAIRDLQPESGGPSWAIAELAAATAALGHDVGILALEYGATFQPPVHPVSERVTTTLVPCRGWWARHLAYSPVFGRTLKQLCQGKERLIVHASYLWLPVSRRTVAVARELNVPLVVTVHGMLTRWALRYRGWKKRLAWGLYQRRDLECARVLHATSAAEAADIRATGLRNPIAVVPVGVRVPALSRERPRTAAPRTVLFLSRIHPKKGLLDLVEAWAAVRPKDWRVVIAGGDDNGYRAVVESAIQRQGLADAFCFLGPVPKDQASEVYASADVFVLPTHSENFGQVVAEALACGVPAITTRGAPWEELRSHRCGWWIDIGARPLAEALREALALSDDERQAMGSRGRALVERQYAWPAVAAKMVAVYEWMLGGPAPACLRLD